MRSYFALVYRIHFSIIHSIKENWKFKAWHIPLKELWMFIIRAWRSSLFRSNYNTFYIMHWCSCFIWRLCIFGNNGAIFQRNRDVNLSKVYSAESVTLSCHFLTFLYYETFLRWQKFASCSLQIAKKFFCNIIIFRLR